MAVYYATTQQRALGRVLCAKQVREWIRGLAVVKAQKWNRSLNIKSAILIMMQDSATQQEM